MQRNLPTYDKIMAANAIHEMRKAQYPARDRHDSWWESLGTDTVFDCRALPIDFVIDTGAAAYDELLELRQMPKLPAMACYFEFADGLAFRGYDVRRSYRNLPDVETPAVGIEPAPSPDLSLEEVVAKLRTVSGSWPNSDFEGFIPSPDVPGDLGQFIAHGMDDDDLARIGYHNVSADTFYHLFLGVLALLSDRLLLDAVRPVRLPARRTSRRWNDKPEKPPEIHVLTVNVPAVRYAARAATTHAEHESPTLHWRRGHWRTLHRGSEFESRTWVRRCLVGDPDKGFISTQYRLTHKAPVIVH